MEELAEDTLYFLLKSGLQDRIQFDHQANANKQSDNSEQRWGLHNIMVSSLSAVCRFWAQVDRSLLPLLDQPWSYRHDLQMFGYSLQQYLDNLNIPYSSS